MTGYSTREAAKKLGVALSSLTKYVTLKQIPVPPLVRVGGVRVRLWSDTDIEHVRQLLPKIANGRKTRYQKLRDKQKAPAKAHSTRSASSLRAGLVPHKTRSKKKK